MKTIKELRNEGAISDRAYKTILRNAVTDINYLFGCKRLDYIFDKNIETNEVLDMTVKDLFDMIGEERIKRWRNCGTKCFNELKGLI